MSEVPTKPGWWVWSESQDDRKEIVEVSRNWKGDLMRWSTAEEDAAPLDGCWHHEVSLDKPASPWRPASEPPVVPEGFYGVEVLTKVPRSNGATKNMVQVFTRNCGWDYSSTVAWMPIPPHGEGGVE